MNPGKLNKRIKIMKSTEIEDGAGGYLDNWKTEEGWMEVAKLWASVEPLKGRKLYLAQQSESEVSHEVIIRYRSDIEKGQTINFKGRRFDIDYFINPGESNRYLELMCVEKL